MIKKSDVQFSDFSTVSALTLPLENSWGREVGERELALFTSYISITFHQNKKALLFWIKNINQDQLLFLVAVIFENVVCIL